jgi:aldose 1-epimerase
MSSIVIQSERLRLEVVPGLGAGIADLSLKGPLNFFYPLWRRARADATWFNDLASYTLVPWSNRIARAAFTFAGREHRLRADWIDGTAIHGDAKARPWTILDRSPFSARLQFDSRAFADVNWPWPFKSTIRYELDDESLATDLSITNLGDSPMPAGCGFHPYFMRALWDQHDDVRVGMRTTGRYPCNAMLPTGPAHADEITAHFASGQPLGTLDLDDVFAGFDGKAEVLWPASAVRARFECSPNLAHSVVFTPQHREGGKGPLPWFCLEPVSMVNDGFNLLARGWKDTGVVVLPPGVSAEFSWRMYVESL